MIGFASAVDDDCWPGSGVFVASGESLSLSELRVSDGEGMTIVAPADVPDPEPPPDRPSTRVTPSAPIPISTPTAAATTTIAPRPQSTGCSLCSVT